jgi:hypothetical protein
MTGAWRGRNEAGWTVAEAIAALALVSLGLTLSFSVLIRMSPTSARIEEAALRAEAAERIMERTLALPFDEVASRTIRLEPDEVAGRLGWRAVVRVEHRRPSVKSIEVAVMGGGARSSFTALTARKDVRHETASSR